MKRTCIKCNEKASFFHSKCCNAHLEGIVTDTGEMQVACEKCKKYVATLFNPQKDITSAEARLLIEYLYWIEDIAKVQEMLKNEEKNATEKVSKVIHILQKLINKADSNNF